MQDIKYHENRAAIYNYQLICQLFLNLMSEIVKYEICKISYGAVLKELDLFDSAGQNPKIISLNEEIIWLIKLKPETAVNIFAWKNYWNDDLNSS